MDRKPPAGQTTITINTTGYPAQQQPTYIPAQNYVPPPQYVTAHPAPPISNESWLERNQRNKPQSNSVGAATLVFVTGGMNIAWSFGYTYYPKGFNDLDMKTSWFIAVIIGVVFAAALSLKLGKKIFYLIASTLTVVGGILFTAVPNSYAAIMVARYLNGFANGFTFVPCLIMAGEEAVKETRGTIAATIESMSFGLGMYLQILFGVLWTVDIEDSFSVNQIHGILVIVYGVMSLLISAFLVIESPVYHLVNNQEQLAIDSLRRLQRPHVLNYETFMLLEEHKRYIAENKALSLQEAFIASLPAIFKLCIYRGMLALTYSAIINYAFALAVLIGNRGFVEWPFIISASVRWLSTLIVAIFMETCGRKKSMITSMVVCATLSFAVAGIFENGWFDLADMQANMWLLIVFQVFAGSFGCASSAYLSEAFPLAIKPIGIASAFCTEMLVNIIILTTFPTGSLATFSTSNLPVFSSYFFAFGGLGLAYCVFSKICFPETMRTTLREAQAKFRPFVAKKE